MSGKNNWQLAIKNAVTAFLALRLYEYHMDCHFSFAFTASTESTLARISSTLSQV